MRTLIGKYKMYIITVGVLVLGVAVWMGSCGGGGGGPVPIYGGPEPSPSSNPPPAPDTPPDTSTDPDTSSDTDLILPDTTTNVGDPEITKVPSDAFTVTSLPDDPPATKWQKDMYRPLGDYTDADGCYQNAALAGWADQAFAAINAVRAENGLSALQREPHLNLVIQAHVRDCALNGYLAHDNKLGMDLRGRIDAINPPVYMRYYENLNGGAGWFYDGTISELESDGPAKLVADWMGSPDHREHLLKPDVQYIGIGVYYLPTGTTRLFWGAFLAGDPSADPASHDYLDPQEVQ